MKGVKAMKYVRCCNLSDLNDYRWGHPVNFVHEIDRNAFLVRQERTI